MLYNCHYILAKPFLMRPLQANDEAFFSVLHQDPLTFKYTCASLSTAQVQSRFNFFIKHNKQGSMLSFVIESVNNLHPLGLIALTWSKTRVEVELGVLLLSEYFGQGIAETTLKAMIEFAHTQLKLNMVMLRTHQDNAAMLRVINKLDSKSITVVETTSCTIKPQTTVTKKKKSLQRAFNIHYINHSQF